MILISIISGILFWTFIEYILHRFLGHVHKGNNFFKSEHKLHHSIFDYFAPIHKKSLAALIVIIILTLLTFLFIPTFLIPIPLSFIGGFFSMYILYEITHYRYHSNPPLSRYLIFLRKHHLYHHFHNPKMNYGVTTRIWDRVFGTIKKVDKVKMPKIVKLRWLIDGDRIKKEYKSHFFIK